MTERHCARCGRLLENYYERNSKIFVSWICLCTDCFEDLLNNQEELKTA
jgi:hypothetical protein